MYEGEMVDSRRHGRGICLYSNDMVYQGEWKRNKEHGQGQLWTADRKRMIYQGEFERGRMQGVGSYYHAQAENSHILNSGNNVTVPSTTNTATANTNATTTDTLGSRYEGDFKENMRNGFGKYILPNNSVYTGMWREGMMNGRGVFIWPDHSSYEGEWKDGKRYVSCFVYFGCLSIMLYLTFGTRDTHTHC